MSNIDPKSMSPIEKISTAQNLLDGLADAQGRAKCGYIYIINEFLNELYKDVLVMQERLKTYEKTSVENKADNNIDNTQNT